jgi:rhodanese-related sulfurtransferase
MVHIPFNALRERMNELNSQAPIVLCSAAGQKSYLAQRALLDRGKADIYYLDGGSLAFDAVFS